MTEEKEVAQIWEEQFGMRPSVENTKWLMEIAATTRNPHKHRHQDLVALEGSLSKVGFKNVVALWSNPETGRAEIVYGAGRIMSADKRGLEKLPVVWMLDFDKAKAKFLRLADNRVQQLAPAYDDDIIIEDLKFLRTHSGMDFEFLKLDKFDKFLVDDLAADDLVLGSVHGNSSLGSMRPELHKPLPPANDNFSQNYAASGMGLADTIYPGEPEYGIPVLSLKYMATAATLPFVKWGEVSARKDTGGTRHFYAFDGKLSNLFHNPNQLLYSNSENFVEVNFSIRKAHPKAYALGQIYRKRQISRWLQSKGHKIFVDLNVGKIWQEKNLLGVPENWTAFCTRGSNDKIPFIADQFALAFERAGGDEILAVVYGGGSLMEDACKEMGAIYIPERMSVVRGEGSDGLPPQTKPTEEPISSGGEET